MTVHHELHPVERALDSTELVPRDGAVVVAVSGGADSMALVEELRGRNGKIVVAHFDHRLRDDSERDAKHVEAYARAHELEFRLGVWRRRTKRASSEEAARDARNDFLASVAEPFGACVATAHTQSDQVETVLMRILRGTGRTGLAGIPARRGPFVRPLLGVTRADTRDYCKARGVDFVDDPSNDDLRFFRNRVRHEILPALRATFPSIDEALLRLAESARREQHAFRARSPEPRDFLRREEASVWALGLDAFPCLDDEDTLSLLRDALAHAGLARDVGRVHYQRLLEMVRRGHTGASADLPGVHARREHDALVFTRRGSRPRAEVATAVLPVPGQALIGGWVLQAELISGQAANFAGLEDSTVACFDAGAVSAPLRARAPREGDRMHPFGLNGHKKLSDLFVDRKIPRRHRTSAIVIEGDVIHWVLGLARSEEGRVGPDTTRVLRLKATRA